MASPAAAFITDTMSEMWKSFIAKITGQGNVEELERNKYRKELSESCRKYEERVRTTPHCPSKREYINYDSLLESERQRMEEKEKAAEAAKNVHNIWRCQPLLPSNSNSANIPKLTVRDSDQTTKDADVHIGVEVPLGGDTWCGPRTEVKTYTQSDLHLSRSQLWERHFERERNENCHAINNNVPMTDGHGDFTPRIQRGFYLGCETPSTGSATPDRTATSLTASLSTDSARPSSKTSPQSTQQPCDSATTSFDNDVFNSANSSGKDFVALNGSAMPAFMYHGCHDLRDLNRRLQDLSNDQHEGNSTKSETSKPGKRVEFQPFPSYKNGTTEDITMKLLSPHEAPAQNDPPRFITRSMRNIGKPDDESVHDTSAFSKKPITPPITGRSVISQRLSQPVPHQSEFLERTQAKHTITDPSAEYRRRLEQNRRQKSAFHSVRLQEQDDCDNAISSDSEVDNLASYDTVDEFDWDAPLTPRFEGKGYQGASGIVRQPNEAARSTATSKDASDEQEAAAKQSAAAKQEAAIRAAIKQRQRAAAAAVQHALKTKTTGQQGQGPHKGKSVKFAETSQRACARGAALSPTHPSCEEAYREYLARRAIHSSYPPAPKYEPGNGRHSQEELALEKSRGQRWAWNFMVVENDAWTLEGLRTNPKTREPVISL